MNNRTIKFRAKTAKEGVWVYGSYLVESRRYGSQFSIVTMSDSEEDEDKRYLVDYTTLGQFTNRYDKNRNGIWEGDIVKMRYNGEVNIYVIMIEGASTYLMDITDIKDYSGNSYGYLDDTCGDLLEVIGNIYDNEKLIKVKKKKGKSKK